MALTLEKVDTQPVHRMLIVSRAAEAKLVETLSDISVAPQGWYALIFNLSELLDEYKSEYQIKIAVNLINDLLKNYEGGIHVCTDGTIAVLCRGISAQLANKLIFQLRYLYMDDPLAYHPDGSENVIFCTLYDLERDGAACRQQFQRKLTALRKPQATVTPRSHRTLSAETLAEAERLINTVQLDSAVRRQSVCAIMPQGGVRRVFDELYIHIASLRGLLKTDIDLLSNKWLFKHLTHALDQRMLDMMERHHDKYLDQPVSINVNLETLLSERFTRFDASLSPAAKVAIVFELQVMDIMADMTAYNVARKNLQKLGYRICLDGVTQSLMHQINRARLGADLLKLQWNADVSAELGSAENRALKDAVAECGAKRVILCRCDSKEAVDYGMALGISLYQGRYVDRLLNPAVTLDN